MSVLRCMYVNKMRNEKMKCRVDTDYRYEGSPVSDEVEGIRDRDREKERSGGGDYIHKEYPADSLALAAAALPSPPIASL